VVLERHALSLAKLALLRIDPPGTYFAASFVTLQWQGAILPCVLLVTSAGPAEAQPIAAAIFRARMKVAVWSGQAWWANLYVAIHTGISFAAQAFAVQAKAVA
jgi:hypothetical protein